MNQTQWLHVVKAIAQGIVRRDAQLDLTVDDATDAFILTAYVVDDFLSPREWPVARERIDGQRLKACRYDEVSLVNYLREVLHRIDTGLDVCRVHPDCRECPDIGRVCLMHRRNGVRGVNVSCSGGANPAADVLQTRKD